MQEWWPDSLIKIDICPFRACWTGRTHSVPGGSSCQLGLLQQHHIFHATFGQVIGHAGPHTPTPDDHSFRGVFPPLSQRRGCIAGREEGRVTCGTFTHTRVRSSSWKRTPHLSSACFLAVQLIVLTDPGIAPWQAVKSLRTWALTSCSIRDMAQTR